MNTVGILALQGDFTRHQEALDTLGVSHTLIYKPEALEHCDRLIIPGGESSTLLKLMEHTTFFTEIKAFAAAQKPILGTCAGLILLAKNVTPDQASLGLLDITVTRNAYGRQLESFSDFGTFGKSCEPLPIVCVRAPKITQIADSITPLVHYKDQIMAVQQGSILGASFHPELSMDLDNRLLQHFIDL